MQGNLHYGCIVLHWNSEVCLTTRTDRKKSLSKNFPKLRSSSESCFICWELREPKAEQHVHTHNHAHAHPPENTLRRWENSGGITLQRRTLTGQPAAPPAANRPETTAAVWKCVFTPGQCICMDLKRRTQECTIIIMHENLQTQCTPACTPWVFYELRGPECVHCVHTHGNRIIFHRAEL